MSPQILTAVLAERIMGWRVGPDRFLLGDRKWKPRHRFQPLRRLPDALLLLAAARPDAYSIRGEGSEIYSTRVVVAGRVGEAKEATQALAISVAVARAVGVDVDAEAKA